MFLFTSINFRRIAIPVFAILGILLNSCSGLNETPLPTLYPTEHIPTVIAMTLEAQGIELEAGSQPTTSPPLLPSQTPTIQITQTSPPSPTLAPATSIPSITPNPPDSNQVSIPAADIPVSINQILDPGAGSKVLSPFMMLAAIKPGDNSAVRIELFGQDGQLLMREVRSYQSLETDWLTLGSEISYGINSIAEPGRLQVSIEDEHGRLKAVSSIDLVLQSIGDQDLNQPDDKLENIVLLSPRPNLLIQGGNLRVSGIARPRTSQPLRIEIVTSDGKIVGTRQVSVNTPDGNQFGSFAIDVPYNIPSTNRVRIQVWEPGSTIPGIIHLSSVEVLLSP